MKGNAIGFLAPSFVLRFRGRFGGFPRSTKNHVYALISLLVHHFRKFLLLKYRENEDESNHYNNLNQIYRFHVHFCKNTIYRKFLKT